MTVSSRIAVMDHGRIVQVATPTEIYEYPNSRYVASFLGDVNIVEGRMQANGEDHAEIVSAEAGCTIHAAQTMEMPAGSAVWVALRPEKLEISREQPATQSANCMTGTVWDIGYLGSLSIYHVKLESGKMVTAARANATRSSEPDITWEDQVYLSWKADSAVVLIN